jgi:peptidoglycan/LPS O-acetylase OafA/YrhL
LKIPVLDFYRGIAILSVFIHHLLFATFGPYPFDVFDAGVPIFFVISGFCIHLSFTQNPSWTTFFNKRFFRIYPPYLAALIIFIIIFNEHEKSLGSILHHTILVHNFIDTSFYRINPSFWSIAVEVQLYLIYPLLILILQNFPWNYTLISIAILEFSIRCLDIINPLGFLYYSPFTFWFSWSLGAYLANLYKRNEKILFTKTQIFSCICITLLIHESILKNLFFTSVAITTFLLLANEIFKQEKQNKSSTLLFRHLSYVGIYSYSFYLLHQPILNLIVPAFKNYNTIIFISCCILSWFGILLLSRLFYRIFEKPSINIGKKFLPKIINYRSIKID